MDRKYLIVLGGQYFASRHKTAVGMTYFKQNAQRYNKWGATEAVAASNGALEMVEEEFAHVFSEAAKPQHVWKFLMTKFELVNQSFEIAQAIDDALTEWAEARDYASLSAGGPREAEKVRLANAEKALDDLVSDGRSEEAHELLNRAMYALDLDGGK